MAYRELIKNFDKIRAYVRDFYVYGFRTRREFAEKSARSYDNERRRVESWLKDAMQFRQDSSGKRVFISVDGRNVAHNPLYQAFKAKSFTDTDVILHFYILDCLADGQQHSLKDIAESVFRGIQEVHPSDRQPDDATVRNKLREYVRLGMITAGKHGRELLYARTENVWAQEALLPAIAFASEAMPLGVVGSFLLDRYPESPEYLSFKHHYLASAFDSEVLELLLTCRRENRTAEIRFFTRRSAEEHSVQVFPLHVYISTQNGRDHLLAYNYRQKRFRLYRLDRIRSVRILQEEPNVAFLEALGRQFAAGLWGVSAGPDLRNGMEHLELRIHVGEREDHIVRRLLREKRNGCVTEEAPGIWKFEADVADAKEMLPWIRSFTGRILSLSCSNYRVTEQFYEDLGEMMKMYEVD